jgi:hypothetical protein
VADQRKKGLMDEEILALLRETRLAQPAVAD